MSRLNITPRHAPVRAFHSLSASNGERGGEGQGRGVEEMLSPGAPSIRSLPQPPRKWVAQASGLSRPATRRTEWPEHTHDNAPAGFARHGSVFPVGDPPTGPGESPALPTPGATSSPPKSRRSLTRSPLRTSDARNFWWMIKMSLRVVAVTAMKSPNPWPKSVRACENAPSAA